MERRNFLKGLIGVALAPLGLVKGKEEPPKVQEWETPKWEMPNSEIMGLDDFVQGDQIIALLSYQDDLLVITEQLHFWRIFKKENYSWREYLGEDGYGEIEVIANGTDEMQEWESKYLGQSKLPNGELAVDVILHYDALMVFTENRIYATCLIWDKERLKFLTKPELLADK